MAERTLPQVATELQQVREKISKLELDIEAQRDKALELSEELAGMMSETLGAFGKTMTLRDKDGLPQAPSKPRAARTAKPQQETGEPSTRVLKDWAASESWTYTNPQSEHSGKKPSDYPKRLPVDMMEALSAAYKAAHPLAT